MRRSERGSAIAAAAVVVILVAGIAAALVTVSLPLNRASGMLNEHVVAAYAAEAGLEYARYFCATSQYDDTGNLWLMQNSIADDGDDTYPESGDAPAFPDLDIGSALVDVWVYSLDTQNLFYRIVARAEVAGRQVTMAQDVRARDTFARYMFFVDADYINFGTTTVRGAVHVNRHINFHNGGAHFHEDVSAVNGFQYEFGAIECNTTFHAGTASNAQHINMPSVNEINALRPQAQGVYDVHNDNPAYGGSGTMNAELEFNGDMVRIVARRAPSNTLVSDNTVPVPENGVIFVQGDVLSVKGKSSGRTTVATMGKVNITDRVTYVDQDGDPAYVLYKDGVPVPNNNTPGTTAWTEQNGYEYLPNPDYNPPAEASPVIGLLAAQEVEIPNSAPYNMEMHAAVFSATKNWFCNLGSKKGNLRVLGSLVTKKRGWRYTSNGNWGYAKSGEYIYDQMLLQNPPPFWLPVDKPIWGARWKVSQS